MIKELADAVRKGNVSIFAGAGISVLSPTKAPTWSLLKKTIIT